MTAQLVGFQNDIAGLESPFPIQLIMVNDDDSEEAMHTYARGSGIGFPMIRYDSRDLEEIQAFIGAPDQTPLPGVRLVRPDGSLVTADIEEAVEQVGQALATAQGG